MGAGGWTLWALRDVTFDVKQGEVVGLVGPNGSGKTTLLRTAVGIYRPDEGEAIVRGRVAPILSMSAGMQPELSGWENIELAGVLLGFSRQHVRAIASEIAEFSELGDFLDAPVRVYSSGMRTRLGFAIAAFAEADVLALDEVLAAGDRNFREKSEVKIQELISDGRTVLVSSHDTAKLTKTCNRLIRLDRGRVMEVGEPETVALHYSATRPARLGAPADAARPQEAATPLPTEAVAASRAASNGRPAVSVIVAAYNEERHITECLRSLQEQSYRWLEVLVVDDGSTDTTARIVEGFEGVRLLRQEHCGAGAARNLGARHAGGDILVFLDADMVFPPEFVERLVAPMLERRIAGTFTKEIKVANPASRWATAHMIGRGLPRDSHFRPSFPNRWENFRAIWRTEFARVGGFDEIGHGEDVTLGRKLGSLAEAAPGTTCYHYEPENLRDIFLSASWFGRGDRITENPNPSRNYSPWRSLPRAVRLAVRHRSPSLFVYRLVWDAGVMVGWLTRGRGAGK